MQIHLTDTTVTRRATVYVEPDGYATVIPHIEGAWIGAAIAGATALIGARQQSKAAEGMQVRPLAPEEQAIIDQMAELAQGDPELGERYAAITKRALRGETSPVLEQDLAAQKAQREERVRKLGDGISETAIRQGRELGAESADIQRQTSRQEMIRLGEQLMSSRTGRLTAAAGTALAPLAEQRGEAFGLETEKARIKAGAKAGLVGAAAQIGAAKIIGGK